MFSSKILGITSEAPQKLDSLSKLWLTHVDNDFDRNDEILLTRTAALVTPVQENNENILMKRTLLSNLVPLLCQNALDSKKLQLCER
ncbi:unnamed protein product [Didymodactylos carnosus]|uniref:Uncharacterized protein n=1 Tax=Didymodactylos carnosus TaxID=1234261 RepID=A0A814NEG6_9BILA|nr:unnamed protein product [Didymodactylos carnosus]CAF3857459.1 unnamed protein product [Didymodactylos carnosus]